VLELCEGCRVLGDCLDYALEHPDVVGVWGGLSEKSRRVLKRLAA
jgi:WhiB family redox-sensing transcriptional regulator